MTIRHIWAPLLVSWCAAATTGCGSPSGVTGQSASERLARSGIVATIDGRAVTAAQLLPSLMEASGAEVLEELVIDSALRARAARAGVSHSESLVQAEHARLIAALREQVDDSDGWTSAQLIEQLQRSRGLGRVRYRALLERTALLRAIAAREVDVSQREVRLAYERAHGTRYEVRLITLDTAIQGQSVVARLERGESFDEVAALVSTHASAATGGAIGILSTGDPGIPSVIREVLPNLRQGESSSVLALDRGVALVQLVSIIPGDGTTLESVRESLETQVHEELVRQRMATLAQEMLLQPSVTVHDSGLERAWRDRRR